MILLGSQSWAVYIVDAAQGDAAHGDAAMACPEPGELERFDLWYFSL
jgi:hypothetical protein